MSRFIGLVCGIRQSGCYHLTFCTLYRQCRQERWLLYKVGMY